jgi:hypothetical protein
MDGMVFEDLGNIGLLCALMGIGIVAFIGVVLVYLMALAWMEDTYDR